MSCIVVYCTFPDEKQAREMAAVLLDQRLAACCTVSSAIQSMYHWQGSVEHATEYVLTVKTHRNCYENLEKTVLKHHPYEVPEIIAHQIDIISDSYARWIKSNVSTSCL